MKRKKIICSLLLATTVLFPMVSFAEPDVQKKDEKPKTGAEPIALKIGGNITTVGGGVNQDDDSNGKEGSFTFQIPVSDINLKVFGKTANGISYGYVTRFKGLAESLSIGRSYFELGHASFGVFQLGNVKGPDDSMGTNGAYELLGGTGGLSGSVADFYNMSAGVYLCTSLIGSPGIATKAVYYTPELYGFKFGVSFTPDTSHRGKQSRDNTRVMTKGDDGNEKAYYPSDANYGWGLNNWTFGLSYSKTWGDFKFDANAVTIREDGRFVFLETTNISGAYMVGSREAFPLQQTTSYMFSTKITYKDIEVAAGYLNNMKSRMFSEQAAQKYMTGNTQTYVFDDKTGDLKVAKDLPVGYRNAAILNADKDGNVSLDKGDSGRAWNLGVRYTMGSYQFALGGFRTLRRANDSGDKASLSALTATVDFKALDGLVLFGEVTAIQTRTTDGIIKGYQWEGEKSTGRTDAVISNNNGAVFLAGTKVSF